MDIGAPVAGTAPRVLWSASPIRAARFKKRLFEPKLGIMIILIRTKNQLVFCKWDHFSPNLESEEVMSRFYVLLLLCHSTPSGFRNIIAFI